MNSVFHFSVCRVRLLGHSTQEDDYNEIPKFKGGGKNKRVKGTLVCVTVLLTLCAVKTPAAAVQTEEIHPAVRQENDIQGRKAVYSVMGMSFILAGTAAALIVARDRKS